MRRFFADRRAIPPWLPWVAGAAALLRAAHLPSDWVATHWFFGYEHEFVRRGLVGSVLRGVTGEPTRAHVDLAATLVLLAAATALLALTLRCTRGRSPSLRSGIALAVATCPATLSQLAHDVGRFDQLNLLLALCALGLLLRASGGAALVSGLLVAAAMAVHEAFFFVHLPFLVAAALFVAKAQGRTPIEAIAMTLFGVASLGGILVAGPMETVDAASLQAEIGDRSGLDPDPVAASSRVLYRDLPENVRNAIWHLRKIAGLRAAAVPLLLAPWVWGLARLLRPLGRELDAQLRARFALLVASACAPLLLCAVGSDFFRWMSLAVIDLLLVALLLLRLRPDVAVALPGTRPGWLALAALGLAAGPAGVFAPLPGLP